MEADLAVWRTDWSALLERMQVNRELSPVEAAELAAITEMIDFNEADVLKRRNTGIDRDAAAFSGVVREFCQQVAPDLVELAVEDAVERLTERLEKAQGDRARRDQLQQEQAQAHELLSKIVEARGARRRRHRASLQGSRLSGCRRAATRSAAF